MGFPAERESATAARRFAERTLHDWRCEALLESTRLLVSELVINAVLHAASPAHVRLRLADGRLRVEVSDDSPALPRRQPFSPTAPSGRGLRIVDALASDWGVEQRDGPPGKTVWFELTHDALADDLDSRTA